MTVYTTKPVKYRVIQFTVNKKCSEIFPLKLHLASVFGPGKIKLFGLILAGINTINDNE